jgi:hypothetical protein
LVLGSGLAVAFGLVTEAALVSGLIPGLRLRFSSVNGFDSALGLNARDWDLGLMEVLSSLNRGESVVGYVLLLSAAAGE